MKYRAYLDVDTWVDREGDDEPWGDRGATWGQVRKVGVSKISDKEEWRYSYRDAETDLKSPFYVVYATYVTGDTFGSDWEATIVGICKDRDEAEALETEAREFGGFGALSNGFYVPWNGYFESLNDIYVEFVG